MIFMSVKTFVLIMQHVNPVSHDEMPELLEVFAEHLFVNGQASPHMKLREDQIDQTRCGRELFEVISGAIRLAYGITVSDAGNEVISFIVRSFVFLGLWLDSAGDVFVLINPNWAPRALDGIESDSDTDIDAAQEDRNLEFLMLYPKNHRFGQEILDVEGAWSVVRDESEVIDLTMDCEVREVIDLTMD